MFRHVTLWVIVSFCAGLGLASLAAASPKLGHYESGTLGGAVLDGRVTEGLTGLLPAVGDELHAASWDGTTKTLATQWEITGVKVSAISAPLWTIPLSTGTAIGYRIDYAGGVMNLKAGGPWDADGADYLIDVGHYSVTLTLLFDSSANLVSGTSVIEVEGSFQAYPTHKLVFGLASGVYRGKSPTSKPADYPSFPAGFAVGTWGIVNNMQFDITPEPATLSLLALGGLAMVARRRRN
jgi:hypothetical protein